VFDIEWRKRTHNEYRQFITVDKLQQIQKWLFGKLLLSDRKFFFFLLGSPQQQTNKQTNKQQS
jgi:hypothetical protein